MFEENKEIRKLTTFNIEAKARWYASYGSVHELQRIVRSDVFQNNEVLNIGGGSNLLFVNDYPGLLLHSEIKERTVYEGRDGSVFVIGGAGENWEEFVDWTVAEGLSGLENLAGIPGDVGASAVQNVGAYGVEASDLIHAVECLDVETCRCVRLTGEQCGFAYRNSNFKHDWKGKLIVLRVSFRLKRSGESFKLEYGPLRTLKERLGRVPTPAEVAAEVKSVRSLKLPDPKVLGSAGSFFKNPVVNEYWFREEVLPYYSEVPHYPAGEGRVKISAGWLIDKAGLKGVSVGGAAVYEKQALVIVNEGGATGKDVVRLSEEIQEAVKRKFNVSLRPEVNFIDSSMEIVVLGSGTSKGVPEAGCACRVCRSTDPRDKRMRTSVLVRTNGQEILIDVSPDFRMQAIRENLSSVDAVLLTHSHYDHVGGLDDLRPFNVEMNSRIYCSSDVENDLRRRLDYCFREHPYPGVPTFDMHRLEGTPFSIDGLKVVPVRVMHGKLPIFGYRIKDFAYVTDAKSIADEEKEKLKGLKVLIVNALREREHFAHFNISEALALIEEVRPEEAYLTHFSHELGLHEEVSAKLPPHVHLLHDGLRIHIG